MRIAHEPEVPVASTREAARGGKFEVKYLLLGEPGSRENFGFYHSRNSSDLVSPRHRHNFEQIRIQLRGAITYARTRKMTPGMIGYFPEGAYYGPHDGTDDCELIVFQFGGSSGLGYMSEAEFQANMQELKAAGGAFQDGYFTRVGPDGRKINQDAYEAVWEHARRRPITYPDPRYDQPIFMDPPSFPWTPGEPGISSKLLGAFGEAGPRIAVHRLAPQARLGLAPHSIYFVLTGRGHAGADPYRVHTALHLARGEEGSLAAETESEAIHIALPEIAARGAAN
jgi:hypothetical protein